DAKWPKEIPQFDRYPEHVTSGHPSGRSCSSIGHLLNKKRIEFCEASLTSWLAAFAKRARVAANRNTRFPRHLQPVGRRPPEDRAPDRRCFRVGHGGGRRHQGAFQQQGGAHLRRPGPTMILLTEFTVLIEKRKVRERLVGTFVAVALVAGALFCGRIASA